jgi:protein-disulfide isomerase
MLAALVCFTAIGCGSTTATPTAHPTPGARAADPEPEVVVPKVAAPATEPKSLPGVNVSFFSERERRLWWHLVSELYSPCADQAVSIAQCLEEKRPCGACAPAASFIASRVMSGEPGRATEVAYSVRFTAPKPIDLRDSPTRGPANAPVTIVEWFDFQCPMCRFSAPIIDQAMAKFEGKVRLVHKFFPLKSHQYSDIAARTAFAAMQQGKYWEMEKLLFDHQQDFEPSSADRFAKELRLDMARFRADVASDRAAQWIARDRADGDALGLDGTPFIWINGRPFESAHFRLDQDLEQWIKLEIELAAATAPAAQVARDTAK